MNNSDFEDGHHHGGLPTSHWQDTGQVDYEEEEALHTDPPVGLGRIVGVIVVLHIIAVLGVMAFRQLGKPGEGETDLVQISESSSSSAELGTITYLVKSGDSLPSIARYFEASVAQIRSLNNLGTSEGIRVGQRLKIPKEPSTAVPTPSPAEVAKEIEESVEKAQVEEGPLIAEIYEEPEEVSIPAPMPQPQMVEPEPEPEPVEEPAPIRAKPIVVYEDSEPTIGGESPEEADQTMAQVPTPGNIPEMPDAGEPIGSFETSVPFPPEEPVPSTEPTLPRAKPVVARVIPMEEFEQDTPAPPILEPVRPPSSQPETPRNIPKAIPFDPRNPPQATSRNGSVKVYRVKRGDTLYGISNRYGISLDALMRFNGMSDPRQLRAGMVIRIP